MCEINKINDTDLPKESDDEKSYNNNKESTKNSVDFLLSNNSIESHKLNIHNYILDWKYKDALILSELVINKMNLSSEELSDIYIYKGNAELWLKKIDDSLKSYTKAREEWNHNISLIISQFYLNYSWSELSNEEAFLKAQEELKIAIENNIVEAYSMLWDIYLKNWDNKSADSLYLLWIEMWDINSAKRFIIESEKEIDYKNKHEVNEFYKLYYYLIEEKWFYELIIDLWNFKLKTWNPVSAYNSYKKYFTLTWDIEAYKKQALVLEKYSNSFNFLRDIDETREKIYKEIINFSSIRQDHINKAYWLEKLWDLQMHQWKRNAATNNYKAIYWLWKNVRNLEIIEKWAYKILKHADDDEELVLEIQKILMINDTRHLLTIWNYYEEKNEYGAALENYFIANEYQIAWSSESIINLIYMNYLNENKNNKIEELINKLDDYKILDEEDKAFLRLYINFN